MTKEWEQFIADKEMNREEENDFHMFIRWKGFGIDCSNLERMYDWWMKSKHRMKGKFERFVDDRRWKEFGSGANHGQSVQCKLMNQHRRKMMGQP